MIWSTRLRGIQTQVIDEECRSPTLCGILVGDRHLSVAVGRVNSLGSGDVHLLRGEQAPLERRRGLAVEARELEEAVSSCWQQLEGLEQGIEVAYIVAGVPPEACRARSATVKIDLEKDPDTPRWRAVRSDDIRLLEERACAEVAEPGFTVVEIVPTWYETDSGARLTDPLGVPTRTLRLQAGLVLAEERMVLALLDACRSVGVMPDAVLSAFTVTGGHLRSDETEGRVFMVEVDAWHTTVALHEDGQWVAGVTVDRGWWDVRKAVLQQTAMDGKDLEIWLDDKDWLFRTGEMNERIPWPWRATRGRRIETLSDLFEAVKPAAQDLVREIAKTFEILGEDTPGPPKKTVMMGDDALSLWSVGQVWPLYGSGGGEWRLPERVYGREYVRLSGVARMIGLLRCGFRSVARWQPALEAYRSAWGRRVNGHLGEMARQFMRRWIRPSRKPPPPSPRSRSPKIPVGRLLF